MATNARAYAESNGFLALGPEAAAPQPLAEQRHQ
jgi:hypothetical protein